MGYDAVQADRSLQTFQKTYCLHLHDQGVNQARNKHHFTFFVWLLNLLSYPEDRGSMFLQNVG
jgi:hypothetical protein